MPSGISKIALFIWIVKSQELTPNVAIFCSLNEMHYQFKNGGIEAIKVINCSRCCSFKLCRNAKKIAPTIKNKWHDN